MDWLAWTIIYVFFGLLSVILLCLMVADLGWRSAQIGIGVLAGVVVVVWAVTWAVLEVAF